MPPRGCPPSSSTPERFAPRGHSSRTAGSGGRPRVPPVDAIKICAYAYTYIVYRTSGLHREGNREGHAYAAFCRCEHAPRKRRRNPLAAADGTIMQRDGYPPPPSSSSSSAALQRGLGPPPRSRSLDDVAQCVRAGISRTRACVRVVQLRLPFSVSVPLPLVFSALRRLVRREPSSEWLGFDGNRRMPRAGCALCSREVPPARASSAFPYS